MRKLFVLLTVVALVAVMGTAAFAAPSFSGLLRYEPRFSFDEGFEAQNGGLLAIVNASGSASDDVSYYFRLQASGTTTAGNFSMPLAYIDVKELLGEGSRVRLGRQGAGTGQGFLNGGTRHGISVNVPTGDVTMFAFTDQTFSDVFAGRIGYGLAGGDVGFNVRSEVDGGDRVLGYSADVDFSFDGFGNVYGEFGQTPAADKLDIVFVGVSIDAIKEATGWGNYLDFEYDVDGEDHYWEAGISKTLDNGIATTFILNSDRVFTTRFQVSF